MTRVVNLYKSNYDVYIGRAGKNKDGTFGNPCVVGKKCIVCGEIHMNSVDTISCFEVYFNKRFSEDKEFHEKVLSLKDKVLGCFCKPKDCHGDVIVKTLNKQSLDE